MRRNRIKFLAAIFLLLLGYGQFVNSLTNVITGIITLGQFTIVVYGIAAFLLLAMLILDLIDFGVPGPCAVQRKFLFRDTCGGTCPAPLVCIPIALRPYLPFGVGGFQAAACACSPTPPPAGPGTPGGPGAGGESPGD